jgi:hypothetical protein
MLSGSLGEIVFDRIYKSLSYGPGQIKKITPDKQISGLTGRLGNHDGFEEVCYNLNGLFPPALPIFQHSILTA